MSTWAQWREAAKTPFRQGEAVRMEDGKEYRVEGVMRAVEPSVARENYKKVKPRS